LTPVGFLFLSSVRTLRGKISPVVGKEAFNKIVRRGAGHLADKARREEYERLMRQKKKTPPANEANEVPTMKKRTTQWDLTVVALPSSKKNPHQPEPVRAEVN